VSKINDLLQNLGEPIDSYREWEVPRNYPFPVYRKIKGSLVLVYRIEEYKEQVDEENKYRDMVDSYFKEEIVKSKSKSPFLNGSWIKK